MIIGNGRICKTIKLRKLRDIRPYLLIIRMENVRSVLMHMNSLNLFRIDVSSYVGTLVNYQNLFPAFTASRANTAPYKPAPTIR